MFSVCVGCYIIGKVPQFPLQALVSRSSHLTAAAAAHMTKQQLPHTCSTPAEGVASETMLILFWAGQQQGDRCWGASS